MKRVICNRCKKDIASDYSDEIEIGLVLDGQNFKPANREIDRKQEISVKVHIESDHDEMDICEKCLPVLVKQAANYMFEGV